MPACPRELEANARQPCLSIPTFWVYQPFNGCARFATSHMQCGHLIATYFSASAFLLASFFSYSSSPFLAKYIPRPRLHQASKPFCGEQFASWGLNVFRERSRTVHDVRYHDIRRGQCTPCREWGFKPSSTSREKRRISITK